MKRTDKRLKFEILVTALLSVGFALFVFAAAGNSPVYAADIDYETWTGNITISEDTIIEKRIRASGDVTLTIEEGVSLTAKKGISVTEGNSLTINGSGTLHAVIAETRDDLQGYAGIGGDPKTPTNGAITINGCTIYALGGPWAAGIGGGHGIPELQFKHYGVGRDITINGGDITAKGGGFTEQGLGWFGAGAGIGGSHEGPAENIVINGGTVRADGGSALPDDRPSASAIGAGYGCGIYKIEIHGGKVFVGADYHWASVIGAGALNRTLTDFNPYHASGTIVIDGGQVNAGGYIGGLGEWFSFSDSDPNLIYLSWTEKTDSIRALGYFGRTALMKSFLTKEDRVIHEATPNHSSISLDEWVSIERRTLIPPVTRIHYYIDEDTPYTDLNGEEVITENFYYEDINFPTDPDSDYGNFLGWYMSWHATDAAAATDKVTDKIPSGEKLSSDINLYAGWKRVPYTITYKAGQDGLGGDVEETVYSGDTYKLKENTALMNGGFLPASPLNFFRNWRVEGESEDLDPGYTFTVTGNKTFVGQWGKRKLKVTFEDEDGTVLKETWVEAGTYWDHVDKPVNPTKDPDEQYTYTFDDWEPWVMQIATDSTFTATYDKTPRKYTVKFIEDPHFEDFTFSTKEYEYGTRASAIEKPQVSSAPRYDGIYKYTFEGWSPDIGDVTGDATYTAKYTEELRDFQVQWRDQDGRFIDNTRVMFGAKPSHEDPSKAEDEQYVYTFAGWATEPGQETGISTDDLPPVTKPNLVYYAAFSKEPHRHTVTFTDGYTEGDGSILKTENVNHGSAATAPEEPVRAHYAFAGWDKDFSNITGDLTVKATWTRTDHIWNSGTITTEPTCTEGGVKTFTCTVEGCSETKTESVPALGHDWDEGSVSVAASCTEDGVMTFTCKHDAAHTRTEAITKTGHTWPAEKTVDQEATCTEDGEKSLHCEICGAIDPESVEAIPALGHDWDEGSVSEAASCTEDGVMTFTCKHDAAHTRTEIIPAIGHDWGDWRVTKEATAEAEGEETSTCRNDATHTKTRAIPKLKPADISYRNTMGDGSTWTKGSSDDLSFAFERSINDEETLAHFTGISVDGSSVDPTKYTAESGSVIIKLKPVYLETLSVGKHTLTALFDDGNSASAKFTIAEKKNGKKNDTSIDDNNKDDTNTDKNAGRPKTGDDNHLIQWIALLCASIPGIFVMIKVYLSRKIRF